MGVAVNAVGSMNRSHRYPSPSNVATTTSLIGSCSIACLCGGVKFRHPRPRHSKALFDRGDILFVGHGVFRSVPRALSRPSRRSFDRLTVGRCHHFQLAFLVELLVLRPGALAAVPPSAAASSGPSRPSPVRALLRSVPEPTAPMPARPPPVPPPAPVGAANGPCPPAGSVSARPHRRPDHREADRSPPRAAPVVAGRLFAAVVVAHRPADAGPDPLIIGPAACSIPCSAFWPAPARPPSKPPRPPTTPPMIPGMTSDGKEPRRVRQRIGQRISRGRPGPAAPGGHVGPLLSGSVPTPGPPCTGSRVRSWASARFPRHHRPSPDPWRGRRRRIGAGTGGGVGIFGCGAAFSERVAGKPGQSRLDRAC